MLGQSGLCIGGRSETFAIVLGVSVGGSGLWEVMTVLLVLRGLLRGLMVEVLLSEYLRKRRLSVGGFATSGATGSGVLWTGALALRLTSGGHPRGQCHPTSTSVERHCRECQME